MPVDVSGSRSLPISRGLQELRPFLAAIQDPDDAVSVVAFLSGPLCGVDDDALYAWRRAGGRFSYFADPPPGADARIVRGLRLLADSWKDVRAHGAGAAIGLIVERLGAVARLAAGPEGRTASGNLLKVLALARRLSGSGLAFRDVVERLAEDAPALDLEEMSVEPVDADAVRLMNLHRAKGLEAPDRRPRGAELLEKARSRSATSPAGAPVRGAGSRPGTFRAPRGARRSGTSRRSRPTGTTARAIEIAFEEAERLRLLYVAATRARDTLVVSLLEDKPEKGAWAPLRSVLRDLPAGAASYEPAEPAPAPPLAARLRAGAARDRDRARSRGDADARASSPSRRSAKREGPRAPSPAEEARGTAWGRVLHQLLEAAMRSPGIDLAAARRKPHARGRGPAGAPRRRPARRIVRHDVRPVDARAEGADAGTSRCRSRWSSRRRTSASRTDPPRRSSRARWTSSSRRTASGTSWTGSPTSSATASPALVAHYAPQVTHYRRAWEVLTGQQSEGRAVLHGHRGARLARRRRRKEEEKISLKVNTAGGEAGAPLEGRRLSRARCSTNEDGRVSRRRSSHAAAHRPRGRGRRAVPGGELYVPKLYAPLLPGSIYPDKKAPVPAKGRPAMVLVCPPKGDCREKEILDQAAQRGIVVLVAQSGRRRNRRPGPRSTRPEPGPSSSPPLR